MTRLRQDSCPQPVFTTDRLQHLWGEFNHRFFRGALPSIEVVWSRRLTSSAGMFASRVGPRVPDAGTARRCIRLSVPLLQQSSGDVEHELLGTLAHEMIHQWQFDILKRRPNHGPDFRRKMVEMNREGLGVTISHALDEAVLALAKYAWRCLGCGKVYQRQRRTIRPSRHRCGCCRGMLRPLSIDQ